MAGSLVRKTGRAGLMNVLMQTKKKVLFTGGSGLLALNWAMHIRNDFEVVLGLHKKDIAITGIQSVHLNMETANAFSWIC
jgi:hypothetical protein